MNNYCFRNDQAIHCDLATDRSLLYGDGIFTTLVVKKGQVLLLQEHLDRLVKDARRLKISNVSPDRIKAGLSTAIANIINGIVRVTISRSSGSRGYACVDPEPVYWISISDWPEHIADYRRKGIAIRLCEQRLSRNTSLAGIKHCNRLEQVLARNEWQSDDFQEGLMLDVDENVIEGTMSNLFLIKDQQLFTPDLTFAGVDGIMRARVINCANKFNIPIQITSIKLEDLASADAVFITNSVIEIWPVNHFVYPSKERDLKQHYIDQDKAMIEMIQSELNTDYSTA